MIRGDKCGCVVIREQTPMPPAKLDLALTDMCHSDWYQLVNSKVFFWPTRDRLISFLQAKSQRGRTHDVLIINTRSLVKQYAARITLSPINSGAVRHTDHKRGSYTFRAIADYICKPGKECFAELAVAESVPDMEQHTLSVERWTVDWHGNAICR